MRSSVNDGGEKNREYEYAFMFEPVEESTAKADELREKLQKLGAKKKSEVVMPIAVYRHPQYKPEDKIAHYICVRHEGEHVVFTVELNTNSTVKKFEVNVDKPGGNVVDEMDKLLTALKFPLKDRAEKLQKLGSNREARVVIPITVYRLPQYDPYDKNTPYIRIRHEGEHVAFTVKLDLHSKFVKEFEVNVDKPGGNVVNEMHNMLTALKFPLKYRVEKLRETWNMDDVEIVFDTYPGLPTYIEIEAVSKQELDAATQKLGFDPKAALTKERNMYSRVYGFPKDRKPSPNAQLTFSEGAKKQFEGMFEKNEELFDKLLKEQIAYVKKL